MRKTLRVVLDTNVFVSSFIFQKSLYRITEAWKKDQFIWIVSPEILKEYISVISRPKFHQTEKEVQTVASFFTRAVSAGLIESVMPKIKLSLVKKDPKDNMFLEAAIESKADSIVTGDRHLLDLKSYKDIQILLPAEFLRII